MKEKREHGKNKGGSNVKIEPFGERIAIKVLPLEEQTKSGLILTSSKHTSNCGEVVAVSEESKNYFTIGDKVMFTQNSGVNYTNGTEDYKILNTRDVLCKITEG